METRQTVMEVYQWVMGEAQYHKEQAEKLLKMTPKTTQNVVDSNHQTGLSMAFYQVAAKLENTSEINPIK